MIKKHYGIIGLMMMTGAILVGLYGIIQFSPAAAGIYFIGSITILLIFVYAFCAKCPIRDHCVHVIFGIMTHLMPGRTTGPYTRWDLIGMSLFFGFVALFPQYWLIRNPFLMLAFWVLFFGDLVITHYRCCQGCGNIYCGLRYD